MLKEKYADERRTKIGIDDGEFEDEDLIPEENTVITMTKLGYIKRMSPDTFKAQNRGGKGIKGMQTLDEDVTERMFVTTTHHNILFFTSKGRVYQMKGYQIPEASRTARGTAIVNLLQLQPDEKIAAAMAVEKFEGAKNLIMATKGGMIKKTELTEYANIRQKGIIAISLREDDELIDVEMTTGKREILLITKKGQSIRFNESEVRATGRDSMGVTGMRFSEKDDEVISMQLDIKGEYIMFATKNGMGKRTKFSEFKPQHRGGKGVICYKITEKTGEIVAASAVDEGDQLLLITDGGIILRMNADDVSVIGRNTSGVKIMNVAGSESKVTGMARVLKEDIPEEDEFEETDAENSYEEDTDREAADLNETDSNETDSEE